MIKQLEGRCICIFEKGKAPSKYLSCSGGSLALVSEWRGVGARLAVVAVRSDGLCVEIIAQGRYRCQVDIRQIYRDNIVVLSPRGYLSERASLRWLA